MFLLFVINYILLRIRHTKKKLNPKSDRALLTKIKHTEEPLGKFEIILFQDLNKFIL